MRVVPLLRGLILMHLKLLGYITLASLSWENVSTMIPKMMFKPTVVTRMKKVTSKIVT